MKPTHLIIVLLSLGLLACDRPQDTNTSAFKTEMESRKVQRVTDGQWITFASKVGKAVLDTLATKNDTFLVQKIDSAYGVSFKKIEPSQISNSPKLAQIAEAYAYNAENNIASDDNLQKANDTLLYYTRPIIEGRKLRFLYVAEINKKKLIRKYTEKDNFRLQF